MTFLEISNILAVAFLENIRIFLLTLLFSIPLGLIITFGSMSKFKPLAFLVRTFVWIIRGTPLMLQLFVVMYGPGILFGYPMRDRMMAALIAFVINYACYFSEIYRGGIESISKGQYEAGQVLGLTKGQIFFKITLLQIVKRIIPPMGNEIITLVKDTSLARLISVYEIMGTVERFTARGIVWPLFYNGVFFLAFSGLLTVLFAKIEKKLSYFN